MPKPRSKIDKENVEKKKAAGWKRIALWICPEHKPEAKRMELEVWRTPIVKELE